MSKKFLNKIVSAILVLAICSTAFIGCVVSAEEPTATYTIEGETIKIGDIESSAIVKFVSKEPFAALSFVVENNNYDMDEVLKEESPLGLSNAEFVGAEMVDGGEAFDPEVEFETEEKDIVIIDGDASATNTARYYKSLTVKLTFSGSLGEWRKCVISLSDIQLSKRGSGSDMWTAEEGDSPRNFIHTCTYAQGDVIQNSSEDYYKLSNSYCRFCNERHIQVHPEEYEDKTLSSANFNGTYYPDAINMSYNPDGTVNFNVFFVQDRYVGGYNGSYGHYEVRSLLVTDSDGRKFTQFSGDNGQAQEDISLITKTTHDATNCPAASTGGDCPCDYKSINGLNAQATVDIDAARAAELGYTDLKYGLRMYSFANIPVSEIGEDFYFTLIGRQNDNNFNNIHYGPTFSYSVKDYCYNVINDETIGENSAANKEVAKALLNYGAAAQQYFSETTIKEEDLPNYELKGDSEENDERKITIDWNEIADPAVTTVNGEIAENAYFYGASAIFRTNPTLKFYFRLTDKENWKSENVKVDFTFKDKKTSVTAAQMQNVATAPTYHAYNFTAIGIMDMYEPVNFSFNVNGTEVQTGSYSLAGYAKLAQSSGGELADLTKAMLNYGDKITSRYGQQ